MKWYKKALFGAGLLGLTSLAGYGGESVKSENETNLKLSDDGKSVIGKLKGINITYYIKKGSNSSMVYLVLHTNDTEIMLGDGSDYIDGVDKKIHAIDGKINSFNLEYITLEKFFLCDDNGTDYFSLGLTKEEAEKLREWSNKKLYEAHIICKEKFGDKLKIPYKVEKEPERSIDDILEDFDF